MTEKRSEMRLTLPAEHTLNTLVQLLSQEAEEDYYVYERAPCWYLGLGRRSSLHIDAAGEHAIIHTATGVQQCRVDGTPTQYVRRFLANYAHDVPRVYGDAGFQYAFWVSGKPFIPGRWPLLTLMVPRDELIFDGDGVTVLAEDEARCHQLCDWLQSALAITKQGAMSVPPLAAEIDLCGVDNAYCAQVRQALQEIAEDRYSKVILARTLPLGSSIDMPATLLRGRQANSPRRSFLLRQGERQAVGFCPQLVMKVIQTRVETYPLAGTRAAQEVNTADGKGAMALLNDGKEVIEHVISVKAAIDELNAVCRTDTVAINDLMSVHTRGSVCHLGSRVSGQLAANNDAWDAFNALFPAITACGVPKNAALAAIARLEPVPRELYSGAILLLEGERCFEAALVLRSAFQDAQRCWIQAGAGIIAQSSPTRELIETQEKLASIAPYVVLAQKKR